MLVLVEEQARELVQDALRTRHAKKSKISDRRERERVKGNGKIGTLMGYMVSSSVGHRLVSTWWLMMCLVVHWAGDDPLRAMEIL